MTLSRSEFAHWLGKRLRDRVPTAVVRFGDAEARLLIAERGDKAAIDDAVRKLSRETGLRFTQEEVLEVKALVACAFDRADVLGIRPGEDFSGEHKLWMQKLADLHAERLAAGRHPVAVAHCLLSHEISGDLPELLDGRRVSAVSCRDLRPALEGKWGLGDVRQYQVPSQYSTRDVDGEYEAAMHGVPIWPDAYARVAAALTVRERGEVFLVGAGLFGKDLCIRVREQGGIALDMGSALDTIAGKLTRGPERRALDMHAGGKPVGAIAAELEVYFGVRVVPERVLQVTDPVGDEVDAWRQRPLTDCCAEIRLEGVPVEIAGTAERRVCILALCIERGGRRTALGIWWRNALDENAERAILDDLRRRGLSGVSSEPSGFEAAAVVRRAVEKHGPFADERAAGILVYLAWVRAEARLATISSHPPNSRLTV